MKAPVLCFLLAALISCKIAQSFFTNAFTSSMWRRPSSLSSSYCDSTPFEVTITANAGVEFKGDVLVVPFFQPSTKSKDEKEIATSLKEMVPTMDDAIIELVNGILDEGIFKGDASTKQIVRIYGTSNGIKYLALVGLGPHSDANLQQKIASKFGQTLSALAKELKVESLGAFLPMGFSETALTPFVLGIHDAMYTDNRFKKVPEEGFPKQKLQSIQLLGCSSEVVSGLASSVALADSVASGVKFTKDLVGAPPNKVTPVVIADQARKMAADFGLEVKVLGEKECKEFGMGSYLGVQQGSMFPPQFVHLTYKPTNPDENVMKVALVGKGLTFDSGGYNLKVGGGSMIELMKFDMGGCGAVLGCAKAIAQLKPKNVEVHFITALCENMVSAEAMRPGDILTASNGKTIEVLNTDAEGRLTLADALVYAEKLEVDTIIDLATLTGACLVGLGDKVAGLYSSSDSLLRDLEKAAASTGEKVWHLPLEMEYKESLKSSLADLKNIAGTKGGGSITAALFLSEFVEKTDWAHLDIIGPVWSDGRPTGFGVKMMVEYLMNVKKIEKK